MTNKLTENKEMEEIEKKLYTKFNTRFCDNAIDDCGIGSDGRRRLARELAKYAIKVFLPFQSQTKKELVEKISKFRNGYIKSDLGEDLFNELIQSLTESKKK